MTASVDVTTHPLYLRSAGWSGFVAGLAGVVTIVASGTAGAATQISRISVQQGEALGDDVDSWLRISDDIFAKLWDNEMDAKYDSL